MTMSKVGSPNLFSDVRKLRILRKLKPFPKHFKLSIQKLVCEKIVVISGTLRPLSLQLQVFAQ